MAEMANTTLVNVDIDTAPKLVSYIAILLDAGETAENFQNECFALIEAGSVKALIGQVLSKADVIFNSDQDIDTMGCFQAIVSIHYSMPEEEALDVIKSVIQTLSSTDESKRRLSLQIFVSLFNMLVSSLSKYEVLKAILKNAIEWDMAAYVSHFHDGIDSWIVRWKLSVTDTRNLYIVIAQVLEKAGQMGTSFGYLVKYLSTFSGEALSDDAQKVGVKAVVAAIKAPVASLTDRRVLYASLKKQKLGSSDLNTLVTLLKIFVEGTVADYESFNNENANVIKMYDIDNETVIHSIRLLTLCALCSQEQNLSYDKIASALGVEVEEVEMWVVNAISENLMEAKLDQAMSTVTVSRCAHRSFGTEQWKKLRGQLSGWQKKLSEMLNNISKHELSHA
jgi:translation initiation factor 3 subunit M